MLREGIDRLTDEVERELLVVVLRAAADPCVDGVIVRTVGVLR